MSYCRWCHDSDVYVYNTVEGGFIIAVASNRPVNDAPFPELKMDSGPDDFVKSSGEQNDWYKTCSREKINLNYDGEIIHEETLESTLARLLQLKEIGYIVPDHAIKSITEELNDKNNPKI